TADERLRLAPCSWPAIEDVLPNLGDLGEQWRPPRGDIVGVIMGGFADGFLDIAGKSRASDRLSDTPRVLGRAAIQCAVAYEGELARARTRALIDHAAHRFRECRVTKAIENNLRDCAPPLERLEA